MVQGFPSRTVRVSKLWNWDTHTIIDSTSMTRPHSHRSLPSWFWVKRSRQERGKKKKRRKGEIQRCYREKERQERRRRRRRRRERKKKKGETRSCLREKKGKIRGEEERGGKKKKKRRKGEMAQIYRREKERKIKNILKGRNKILVFLFFKSCSKMSKMTLDYNLVAKIFSFNIIDITCFFVFWWLK